MSRYAALFTDDKVDKNQQPLKAKHNPYTLLLVDDEPGILQALKRVFFDEAYEILTAQDGLQGLEVLEKQPGVNLVICDYNMPEMNGADFLRKVKELRPEIIRIMLTGYADVAAVMGAVNEGAVYKFITKPWNDDDLRITVSLALEQFDLIKKNTELKAREQEYKQEITKLSKFVALNRSQLGPLLIKSGLLDQKKLDDCEKIIKQRNCSMPRVLVDLGYVKESEIIKIVNKNLGIEHIYLSEFQIDKQTIKLLPQSVCEKGKFIPIKMQGNNMTLAMADPSNYATVDDLRFASGFDIAVVMASERDILKKINECYGIDDYLMKATDVLDELNPYDDVEIVLEEEEEKLEELILSKDLPPAIRIVSAIISEATRLKASDIHIEPKIKYALVRFRLDGMLQDKIQIPLNYYLPTVSRLKIMADMDIAERRRPQDGRVSIKTANKVVDLRVSSLPTINGEKIVMRILDRNASVVKVEDLGIPQESLEKIKKIIAKPQGMILATGPTGSGKTTTLYSLLTEMTSSSKNFVTIENPVEYFMDSASQVLIREKAGLDFSLVLRSVLRQDPNIIMVGEIRDLDTAEVAFQAALTGHLVLSTLHTNSSIGTVSRLVHQGVEPYTIASALEGIIAQRLVRRICKHCKDIYAPPEEILSYLGIMHLKDSLSFYHGKGCSACNKTGYSGQIGIYEVMIINEELREMITNNATEREMKLTARQLGMKTLFDDGIEKIRNGETTCSEVLRVLGPKEESGIVCSQCDREIDSKLALCPFCGHQSRAICSQCKNMLDTEWKICPFCGTVQATCKT